MSAQTKKIKQDELRRLMYEQKKKLVSGVRKVDSPLAKYDKDGTLHCIICQTVVRSEAVWGVHLNSKKHKENVAIKAKKKETTEHKPSLKRTACSSPLPESKKVKSILKNAPCTPAYEVPVNFVNETVHKENSLTVLNDNIISKQSDDSSESSNENDVGEGKNKDSLPEGFFDDPRLDAKVRNVEYRDPVEEEWEQFQKEIREETSKAQEIIADDQEEATTERQIDEIDEQMRNWSRVVTLEKKKQQVIGISTAHAQTIKEENSSEDENDFEEFLDWRSKKSFE